MANNIVPIITVQAWADIVIKNWLRKITELDIGSSGELFDSFTNNVLANANGVPERIELSHIYYGIMVDMGVGKGVSYGTNYEVQSRRRKKPWRSKQLFAQVIRLAEILQEKYGMIANAVIKENLDENERQYASTIGSSIPKPKSSSISELDLAWMRLNGLL